MMICCYFPSPSIALIRSITSWGILAGNFSSGSKSMAVQMQYLRLVRWSTSTFIHPSHPLQKDSSSVRSLKVTGWYPNWVFIFITAEPEVSENIFRVWPSLAGQGKRHVLDAFGQSKSPEVGMDDES